MALISKLNEITRQWEKPVNNSVLRLNKRAVQLAGNPCAYSPAHLTALMPICERCLLMYLLSVIGSSTTFP